MELDASLSWLALALTPGLAARLCARLLRQFGSPDEVFRASLNPASKHAIFPRPRRRPSSRKRLFRAQKSNSPLCAAFPAPAC